MLITKDGTSDKRIGSRFNPSCNSSSIWLSDVMMVDGSDKDTKFRTIPSALGKNFSSRDVTTSILDLIGKNTKKPTQPASKMLEIRIKKPATYLDPYLVLDSKLCICAI